MSAPDEKKAAAFQATLNTQIALICQSITRMRRTDAQVTKACLHTLKVSDPSNPLWGHVFELVALVHP